MNFWRLRRQTVHGLDGKQKIKDEDQDLRQNASQGSTNRQIFPLIAEEKLSEQPEPPLCARGCINLIDARPGANGGSREAPGRAFVCSWPSVADSGSSSGRDRGRVKTHCNVVRAHWDYLVSRSAR